MILIVIITFLISFSLQALVLPQDRIYEWNKAGINSEIQYLDTIHLETLGLVGDGVKLNDDVIALAFAKMNPLPSILVFPEGVFKFSKTINIPSNIKIVGQGAERTTLLFDNAGKGNLISVSGTINKDTIKLKLNNQKGDMIITVGNKKNLAENDYFLIVDNDQDKITSDWARNTTGQICQIESITGSEIMLKTALRRDYYHSDSTFIFKISPAQFVQIENLSLDRLDATESQTSNIYFNYSADCKIKCVKSKNCNFAHIDIRNSTYIEIVGSYFESAFDYGGGGKAYGVMIQSTSGECLVYNNIFKHLRHSMILQSGANGNVFSYNYSIDPYWTDVSLPANSAGDAVLHGNYPYSNLFEGNICQNIVIDNSHGINGPDNTFFRNRAELYGIFMNPSPASNHQNFIGNEITNNELFKGLYMLNGIEHFEFGNNIKGKVMPTGTNELDDNSYYLYTIPDWYKLNSSYPPIGVPNTINQYNIEAKTRYLAGQLTSCDLNETKVDNYEDNKFELIIIPNPASAHIYLQFKRNNQSSSENELIKIEVYNLIGIKQFEFDLESNINVHNFDISTLSCGVYYLKIHLSNDIRTTMFIKI